MGNLNIQLNVLAYKDIQASNNPQIRSFDLTYKLLGQDASAPDSDDLTIAPGATVSVFNGVRTTAIDGTTAFSTLNLNPAFNVYRFLSTGGTPPVFRTDRLPGVDSTSGFVVTVNGPVATYTATGFAMAVDALDTPNITFAAVTAGTAGNSITLIFNSPYATATDTLDTPNIVFTALTPGLAGNSISLVFNGSASVTSIVSAWNIANPSNQVGYSGSGLIIPTAQTVNLSGVATIATVVGVWNTANPSNQVAYTGLGTVIPAQQVVTLSGGGTALNTTNVQIGDILKVEATSNFSVNNQGRFTVIAKTATSVSVQNVNAVAESVTLNAGSNFLIYSNGVAGNQVQIGDKVIISAGFSSADFGTYVISDVTPLYFEIAIASPNGIPLEVGIIPGTAGLVFYSEAKKMIFLAAQDRCSVQINGDVSNNYLLEPVEIGNPEKPALYLQQGTVYSLSVTSLSLNPQTITIATVE